MSIVSLNEDDEEIDEYGINLDGSYWELMPNLQMLLGVSWERCFSHQKSFKIYAGWETSFWWQASDILWLDRSLSTQGLTLGASLNF